MPYTHDDWRDRIAQRSDFTTGLVHLTRPSGKTTALDVLLKILSDKRLKGSDTASGFIVGPRPAVCLQEAPLYSLAQNIYTEQLHRNQNKSKKVRYLGFGLLFDKRYVFKQGGRPAIYDKTSTAKTYLPQTEWWRIVNFDLSDNNAIIDWTHEREWRVPEELVFELSDVSILLPNVKQYRRLITHCRDQGAIDLLAEVRGIVQLGDVFF